MANFKTYINSGFSACTLLAYARDHCRNRDVRIFLIPGHDDCVGISDGVDAWIAPTRADVFSVNVERLIADLRAGRPQKPVPLSAPRRTLLDPGPSEPPLRRRQVTAPDPVNSNNLGVQRRALLA